MRCGGTRWCFCVDKILTHAEHEAFSARFGPFAVDAYTQGVAGITAMSIR